MYNPSHTARGTLLEYIKVMRICYPMDSCKQYRETRNKWRTLQQGLGYDLSRYFADNIYDNVDASFRLAKVRTALKNPKGIMAVQQVWRGKYSREKFSIIPN